LQLDRAAYLARTGTATQQTLDQTQNDVASATADVAEAEANHAVAVAGPTKESAPSPTHESRRLEAAAPERQTELRELWRRYGPNFVLTEDRTGFQMAGGAFKSILFTNRTLYQVLLVGFAFWRAIEAYAGLIRLWHEKGQPFDLGLISLLPGQKEVDTAFDQGLADAVALGRAKSFDDFVWPASIPIFGNPKTPAQRTTFDLVGIATAYIFLHEVRHLMYCQDGNTPRNLVREETTCDGFARDLLLEKAHVYATLSGAPLNNVLTKRVLALSLAAFVIIEVTPPELWRGSRSHPPVADRLHHILSASGLPNDSVVWRASAAFLMAKLRNLGRTVELLHLRDERDLFEQLSSQLQ
jgi:hypothetical protein